VATQITSAPRRFLRGPVLAVGLALLIASPAAGSSRTAADMATVASRIEGPQAAAAAGGASQRIDAKENEAALKYWTADRMKNSRPASPAARGKDGSGVSPADRGKPTKMSPSKPSDSSRDGAPEAAPKADSMSGSISSTFESTSVANATSEGYWQASNTANPNRQIGHLFFQQWDALSGTWKNYNCSATVVNSENKSVVWTAAHCVYQTYSNVWNRSYMFCPGYRNGSCALGKWTPYSQSTTSQWQNATSCNAAGTCNVADFQYDFGALKMNAINGYRIANWVGSQGISFNGPLYQSRYLFGYPLNKANGEYLYYCAGDNTYVNYNLRVAPCGAGGGASGGPWLSQINSSWQGVVHSVNSHGDGTFMAGPYQGNVALNLYAIVRY